MVVGVLPLCGTLPFGRVEIREAVGGVHNESFGKCYIDVIAVPEPRTYAMMAAGLLSVGANARRRRVIPADAKTRSRWLATSLRQ